MRAAFVLAFAVAALSACGRSASVETTRQRLAAERDALEADLDRLEERFLADQARVRFWREMRERHETVSAVACATADRHAQGMALLEERQREKRDALARKHRVAARFVPPADVAPDAERER